MRTEHIPHGVGWRGAQSEPERCLPVHEAPPCTTLAVRHASPRPSRTYHASNYLTVAEGPERIGSMVGSRLAT